MPTQLMEPFAIAIQQKLYEENLIGVYQTETFGRILTIDKRIVLSQYDSFVYHEMMAHPALFTHLNPQSIAIIGNYSDGILLETLKHTALKNIVLIAENKLLRNIMSKYFADLFPPKNDARFKQMEIESKEFFANKDNHFDIIIDDVNLAEIAKDLYADYFNALNPDGIFVQSCQTSLLEAETIKTIFKIIKAVGFSDWQLMHFPQPSFNRGPRMIILATKRISFKNVLEKKIFNRSFDTRYYNFDTHKAALALPEFLATLLQK